MDGLVDDEGGRLVVRVERHYVGRVGDRDPGRGGDDGTPADLLKERI